MSQAYIPGIKDELSVLVGGTTFSGAYIYLPSALIGKTLVYFHAVYVLNGIVYHLIWISDYGTKIKGFVENEGYSLTMHDLNTTNLSVYTGAAMGASTLTYSYAVYKS